MKRKPVKRESLVKIKLIMYLIECFDGRNDMDGKVDKYINI